MKPLKERANSVARGIDIGTTASFQPITNAAVAAAATAITTAAAAAAAAACRWAAENAAHHYAIACTIQPLHRAKGAQLHGPCALRGTQLGAWIREQARVAAPDAEFAERREAIGGSTLATVLPGRRT